MTRIAILALLGAAATPASAADAPIRIWGPAAMRGIAEHWADAYRQAHPEARFELTMRGSDTAIPGLYGGQADIALMGRRNDLVDDAGFSRPLGYNVTRIEIANGSRTVPGKSDAIAILVPSGNPLARISLVQLAAIMDCGGTAHPIRTWGELGLGGTWATRPIHVRSYDFASRTGAFFQHVVTKDGRRMCWDRITEYGDARAPDGTLRQAADRVGDAARTDPDTLAIANPAQAVDGLKLVALADADGAAVLPDDATIIARRYPLARRAYAYLNRKPGAPRDARVTAFLAWVLSPEGQAQLAADKGYLPLDPVTAHTQRALVEGKE